MTWNESDYNKWRDYPPGIYWASDLTMNPHPRNTCSYESDGYPVLVTINYSVLERKRREVQGRMIHDSLYDYTGLLVTVWRPKPGIPITSSSRLVNNVDEIDDVVEELKKEVASACLHKNSTALPSRWACDHRFKCNDCGKTWGYDSSG
jgi:hypothetical protein